MTYTLTVPADGVVKLPAELLGAAKFQFTRQKDTSTYTVTIEDGIPEALKDENVDYFEDDKGMSIQFKKGVRAGVLLDYMRKNTADA